MDDLTNLAARLQRDLANVDMSSGRSRRNSNSLELLLLKFQNLKLKIYQERGHAMPHIHVDYGKQHHAASYSIDPAARLEGTLHRKYDDSVISWVQQHKDTLFKIWTALQAGAALSTLVAELHGDA
jgi:Domain of unknown function (DUF4160)